MTPAGIKDVECKSCSLVPQTEGENQGKLEKPVGQGAVSCCWAASRLGVLGSGKTSVASEEHRGVGPEELNTDGQDWVHLEQSGTNLGHWGMLWGRKGRG